MTTSPSEAAARGAFAGVRVIDFSEDIAGPLATMLLADLGAEVIKVESPAGDRARACAGFWCWNRNKLGVRLDLERGVDRELAQRLVASADVAVFDREPGNLAALGLDAASSLELNPSLVHAIVGGWGAHGPWSALPPDETLLLAMNGAAFGQFSYADVPVHLLTPQFRYANGMLAASAIGAALYARERSGRGQALSVNALHASAAYLGISAERAGTSDRSRPIGATGTAPNYKLYRCADGEWLFLSTLLPHHFELALHALDLHADVLAMEGVDGKLRNALMRGVGGRVRERIEKRFAERPRAVWLELLQARDVPAGPCGSRERWFASDQVAANDLRVQLLHPQLGPIEMPGLPLAFSATPGGVRHLLRESDPLALLAARARPVVPPAGRTTPSSDGSGPLHGVEVLDLGTVISTPFAAAILRNFGAHVIKLETPGGDTYRNGLGFLGYNRDKRSLALDLKSTAARRILPGLIERADVVCDNFRAGVLARLGLEHADLVALNPRIISASVTAFGERGPLRDRPGFDPLLQAQSGLMIAQGGDEPVFHQIPVNDVSSGLILSFGVTAALFARERRGIGQRVTTSLAAQSCLLQSGELTNHAGRAPNPVGMRDCPGLSPVRRFYRCADDEWVALACTTAEQVERLFGAVGCLGLAQRWAPELALIEGVDGELAGLIAERLVQRTAAEAADELVAAGVPAVRVLRPYDLHRSPLHLANRYFDWVRRAGGDTALATPRTYAQFGDEDTGFDGREPALGEHSREILRELGHDDAAIDALIAAKHCVQPTAPGK